jgi:hypothetical protein
VPAQGGEARPQGDEAVKDRDKKQQEDRMSLEERQDEIKKAFEGWQENQSARGPKTRTAEAKALAGIRELVVEHLPEGAQREVCVQWANDMAEMIRRMGELWTTIERKSLISLLTRFEKALVELLAPPPAESAYHPAARQPPADLKKVVKLFVSGAGFASCLKRSTDDAAQTHTL